MREEGGRGKGGYLDRVPVLVAGEVEVAVATEGEACVHQVHYLLRCQQTGLLKQLSIDRIPLVKQCASAYV